LAPRSVRSSVGELSEWPLSFYPEHGDLKPMVAIG
jgi:hypothetical protein